MKKYSILILLLFSIISLFGQNNVKVVEYKILKIEKDNKTVLTVPKGENWSVESIVALKEEKIEFYIEEDLYVLLFRHDIGLSDDFLPFILPAETKFRFKPLQGDIALSVAVLKIE